MYSSLTITQQQPSLMFIGTAKQFSHYLAALKELSPLLELGDNKNKKNDNVEDTTNGSKQQD